MCVVVASEVRGTVLLGLASQNAQLWSGGTVGGGAGRVVITGYEHILDRSDGGARIMNERRGWRG
jgi:hypothetical protein